jgi:hypothetical protein
MAELSRTVRIMFLDGQERLFTDASIDMSTEGWLHVTRLQEGPMMSGIAEAIAAYRLEALKGWEYVDAGQ